MSKSSVRLALALLIGIAAGAWGMRFYFERTLKSWSPAERFLAQLTEDLKLTADQKAKAGEILAEQKDRMEELRRNWSFQVTSLDRDGEDRISRLLSPAQMDRFMKQHDKIHGRMDRFLWSTTSGPTAIAVAPEGK